MLILGVLGQQVHAQKTEKQFHRMLKGMYMNTVPLMTPGEFAAKESADYLILDTREENEYKVSHIPEAVWAGYDNFQEELLTDMPKDKPILLYCSVGYRSERIGERLQEMGFTNVHNLYGGIFEWSNKDNKILDENKTPTAKVHGFNREWSKWILKGEKVLK